MSYEQVILVLSLIMVLAGIYLVVQSNPVGALMIAIGFALVALLSKMGDK